MKYAPFTSIAASLCGVGILTYLLSLTRPHCEDSLLKEALISLPLYIQWIIFGGLTAFWTPRHKFISALLFGLLGLPLVAAIWIISLWPPSIFGFSWQIFWSVVPKGYLFVLPLVALGAAVVWIRNRKSKMLTIQST
jgi:hypothetical protein